MGLNDERARTYIKHLEGLVKRAEPIIEAVVDAAQDQESKDMLTDWLRDKRAGPKR